MSNDDKNFVLDQRVPSNAPQNDILQAGMSSGLPEYDLSDGFNNSTGERRDNPAAISNVTPFLDSDANRLLVTRQERLLQLRAQNPFLPIQMLTNAAWSVSMSSASGNLQCPIPSGAKMAIVRVGTGGNALMSTSGNPQPLTLGVPVPDAGPIVLAPSSVNAFYCEEVQDLTFAVIGVTATPISVSFYFQQ